MKMDDVVLQKCGVLFWSLLSSPLSSVYILLFLAMVNATEI